MAFRKYLHRKAKKYLKKKAAKRRGKSAHAMAVKKAGSISNGIVIKYGLQSQGIQPTNTTGSIELVGPPAIPSVYTGGPLIVNFTGTTAAAVPSIFTTSNGSYDFGCSLAFNAADILGHDNMYSQFDSYRFLKVRVNIECLNNVSDQGLGTTQSLPTLYYVIDKDNTKLPILQGDVTGQSNHKRFQFSRGKSCSITFTPALRMLAYSTSTGQQGWVPKTKQWIDTAQNNFVPHFGLKLWFADTILQGEHGGNQFRFTYDYWIEYKSPILSF
jgi:hypothetical protein